jgi:hypothetical protein
VSTSCINIHHTSPHCSLLSTISHFISPCRVVLLVSTAHALLRLRTKMILSLLLLNSLSVCLLVLLKRNQSSSSSRRPRRQRGKYHRSLTEEQRLDILRMYISERKTAKDIHALYVGRGVEIPLQTIYTILRRQRQKQRRKSLLIYKTSIMNGLTNTYVKNFVDRQAPIKNSVTIHYTKYSKKHRLISHKRISYLYQQHEIFQRTSKRAKCTAQRR